MSLQSRARFSKAMLSVLFKCDSDDIMVYRVYLAGRESVKQPCGMYVETKESVCFSISTVLLYIVHVINMSTCLV